MTCTSVFCVLFAICLALRLPLVLSLHNDLNEAKFYKLEGKSLNGNVTQRLLTRDFLDCSFLCVNSLKKKSCLSFNFSGTKKQDLYECELNNSDMNLKLENLQDRQGFAYYGMTEEVGYTEVLFSFCMKAASMNLRCFEICRLLKLKSTYANEFLIAAKAF